MIQRVHPWLRRQAQRVRNLARQRTATRQDAPAGASNPFTRRFLLICAIVFLTTPSAIGVKLALQPTVGEAAANQAAIGFELLYLSTAILVLSRELRGYANRLALTAVTVAVLLNVVAKYRVHVPGGLDSWPQAQLLFDPLHLVIAIIESAPLAGLAFAGATLLHRLDEAEAALRESDQVRQLRDQVDGLQEQELAAAIVNPERGELIARLRDDLELTWDQIGKVFGVSGDAARKAYVRARSVKVEENGVGG